MIGVTFEWKDVLPSIHAVLLLGAAWNVYLACERG